MMKQICQVLRVEHLETQTDACLKAVAEVNSDP